MDDQRMTPPRRSRTAQTAQSLYFRFGKAAVRPEWGLYRCTADSLLRALRNALGKSQGEFAALIELPDGLPMQQQMISQLEQGNVYISEALARRLANTINRLLTEQREQMARAGFRLHTYHWYELVDQSDRTNVPEMAAAAS